MPKIEEKTRKVYLIDLANLCRNFVQSSENTLNEENILFGVRLSLMHPRGIYVCELGNPMKNKR